MKETDFTPRPLRFRVWDGERMLEGDDLLFAESGYPRFVLAPNGKLWKMDADGRTRFAIGYVPLLSTGLADADGREVFEGDVIAFDSDNHRKPVHFVLGHYECALFVMDDDGGPLHRLKGSDEAFRVVGNVFEAVAEVS